MYTFQKRTLWINGSEIPIIIFLKNGTIIGWATNTSCADGPLPTTIEELFPNGALCFLIALYMNNLDFFQRHRNLPTPRSFVEFLRHHMPAEIKHGQFEEKSIPIITRLLRIQIEVITSRPDIMPTTRYGSGQRLHPVLLDVVNGHYVVPGIDVPLVIPPSHQTEFALSPTIECRTCTFVNPRGIQNCNMCGEGFGNARPLTRLG